MPASSGEVWTSWTVRQLRQECVSRGIDLTGCFEKEGILQRLRAASAEKDVREEKLREPSCHDVNMSGSRHEDGSSDPDPTIDWQAKTMRELRREGVLLGVDLRGCFDKADIVQKLKVAKNSVPAERSKSQHDGAEVSAMAPVQSPEAQQSHTARDAPQASPLKNAQPAEESSEHVMQELRAGAESRQSQTRSPKRRQQPPEETAPELATEGSQRMEPGQEPKAEEAEAEQQGSLRDRDELQKRQREPEQNGQNEQSDEPHKQQRIQSTWQVKDPGDMNLVGEPCYNADAKNHVHREAEVQGYALEVVPMRTLIKECKLLGIDASGLYAKCEVINKLMSVLDQTIVYKTAASKFRVLPEGEVGCPGDMPEDSEVALPEPAGPPIALSPFKDSERPKTPPKTNFCPWSLGDPILEEEPEGQEAARGESEEEVEEIIMDVQEGSALKEPGSPSSSSKHQPSQETVEGTTRSGEKEEGSAPKEQSSPSSPRCLPQAGRLDSAESAIPRPRASISELFRLSLSELEARCLSEGVEVGPGDSKGVLISRLKQALSKSATLAASSASSPSQPPFPQNTVSQAEPPQASQPLPSEHASPRPAQAEASCKQEPEMFNIGSDDGSCEEHSDTDFFPDLQGHMFGTTDTSKPGQPESDAAELEGRPNSEHPEAPASPVAKSSENTENMATHVPDEAGEEGGMRDSSTADEPRKEFSTPSDSERENTSAFNATLAGASQGPEVSAASPGKEPAETETPETADELQDSQDQEPDLGFQDRRNGGSMFDFDDLDEAEAEPPATVPVPQMEASKVSNAKPECPLPEKPEETTRRQAAQAPQVPQDPEIPETPKPGESHPLLRFSTKELLELARSRGVDVRGCVEKSDIVDRLTRSPRLTVQPKFEAAPRSSASPQKPFPGSEPARLPKAASKAPPRPKSKATPSRPAPKPGSSPMPDRAKRVDYARPPPQVQAAKAAEARLAGEVPDGWSARIQTWFGRYPGFSALLPPEAEMWTDQELDVYFGSNGDIWPRGKRPAWFGRSAEGEEAKPIPKPQGPRTYPDLKVHFQTLDLAETTPPEVIRRHYRRLARDCHPDKHPDNVEEATRRFQQITEAYEAIANRLKL
ncbi:DNAJB3 [Symbiodinium microadriaticum]|nr:DNAJB3 [Symbiodinium microadriaticum]CAE7916067.1 DNAJB3 [Symbiodinium sp. KB8]